MAERIMCLPPDLDDFVLTSIESGRFESADAMVQAGLCALHREQKVAADKRFVSAIAEGDVFRKLWEACPHSSFSLSRQ
jgi:Arc/MetJ-type ribon-helix-helix transcriptional regulator